MVNLAPEGNEKYIVVVADERQEARLDLWKAIIILWKARTRILAVSFSLGGLAAMHAFLATPIYRSEAVIIVRSELVSGANSDLGGQLGGLAGLAGLNFGSGGKDVEYLAYLKSNGLIKLFIERQKLMPILFADSWNPSTKTWKGAAPTENDAIRYFGESVRFIKQDAKSRLITVTMEWRDAALAASWATGFIASANEQLRLRSRSEAERTIAFLEQETATTQSSAVNKALFNLIEVNINKIVLANVQPDYAFDTIDAARAADPDRQIRPRRLLEVLGGLVVGGLMACFLVLWRKRDQITVLPAAQK